MKKQKGVSYAKWGYVFILPFFISFFIFSCIPLVDTIRYSFYEYYRSGIKEIGPNFVGMKNYISLLQSDMLLYGKNTIILWIIGFIPQIVIALILASWFADARLKLRGEQFFKVVIYLPNLIMASAFAMSAPFAYMCAIMSIRFPGYSSFALAVNSSRNAPTPLE